MKQRLSSLFTRFWPQVVISGVWILLVLTNFTAGTWLSGWDNLLPELNFGLNISRSLTAPWQEYQGLGLLGGMGHAADLTRQLFLAATSAVLEPQLIRYFWTFLMILVGQLGAYCFIYALLSRKTVTQHTEKKYFSLQLASLVGALFYLGNLATVQNFFVPYESFSGFYGFIPWLLWSAIQYFQTGKKKDLIKFALMNLISTSAFYVQTLFVVYLTLLSLFSIDYLVHLKKDGMKRIVIAFATLLAVHAFWFLPVAYFTFTNAQVTVQAHQNLIATPEVQLMNKGYGTLQSIAQLKGFWLDYTDYSNTHQHVYLLETWRNYTHSPLVTIALYALFLTATLGIIFLSLHKQKRYKISLPLTFILCLFILTAGHGKIGFFYTFLSDHLPLFGQMFRSAFTKWSVATSLIYAIGLSSFLYYFPIRHNLQNKIIWPIASLIVLASFYATFPLFQGHLFYKEMKVTFPQEYFEVMKFFESQPKQARIAFLPANEQWGWNFYSWGYRGSGFLWYGIQQPILDRAFDVWSKANEDFYFQLSTALDSQDTQSIDEVFQRYKVSYLLIDKSVITPEKNPYDQIGLLVESMNAQGRSPVFAKGNILVYQTSKTHALVETPSSYTPIQLDYSGLRRLPKTTIQQPFAINTKKIFENHYAYPFFDLNKLSPRNVTFSDNSLTISRVLPISSSPQTLNFPALQKGSLYSTQVKITFNEDKAIMSFPNTASISTNTQTIHLPQLPDLPIELPKKYSSIFFQIQNDEYWITPQSPLIKEFTFRVGDPIIVEVFGSEDTREIKGIPVIDTKNITQSQLPMEAWDPFMHPPTVNLSAQDQNLQLEIKGVGYRYPVERGKYSRECESQHRGKISTNFTDFKSTYAAEDFGAVCDSIPLSTLHNNERYILRIKGENVQGRSIRFYLENLGSQQADLEEILPTGPFDVAYNVLPWPTLSPESGYALSFETRSLGGEKSENEIDQVTVYPVPDQIDQIIISSDQVRPLESEMITLQTKRVGTVFYQVKIDNKKANSLFSLSQAYDPGWIAFSTQKPFQLLDHVVYNGWANGWIVSDIGDQTIIIFYWPQLLECLGLCALVALGSYFLREKTH